MLSDKMRKALNDQINAEMYSSYLYLSMAACFEDATLPGMAKWMYAQAQEENQHAMKIFQYVVERGGRVTLEAIDKPKESWSSAREAFEDAYAHEQKVTKMIDDLVSAAREENDYASEAMLQWFVSEQVEEEASVSQIVDQLNMIKDAPQGLLMLDSVLGRRGG